MWHHQVDILCVGSGIGGVASAIGAHDAGSSVLVVDEAPPASASGSAVLTRRRPASTLGWLRRDGLDETTAGHLAAVARGLDAVRRRDDRLPVRQVVAAGPVAPGAPLAPFHGAAVRSWDEICLGSPYGLLRSVVASRSSISATDAEGMEMVVTAIGRLDADHVDGAGVQEWLIAQADARGITVDTGTTLRRLVFEDARIVGAVLDTPDGPRNVRTLTGVTVAPARDLPLDLDGTHLAGAESQLCLVGRPASRFARVELVTTAAVAPATHEGRCGRSGRGLRADLRVCRSSPAVAGCAPITYRHPAPGQ